MDVTWNTPVAVGQTEVLTKRPVAAGNNKTHRYWYRKIREASSRLRIPERAGRAARNRKLYQSYEDDIKTNAISRKLEVKARATIAEIPAASAQFTEEDDERNWKQKLESWAEYLLRRGQTKPKLRGMLWDNFVGDIAFGRIDWKTRYSAGTPISASNTQRDLVMQSRQIDAEYEQALQGMLPGISPADAHELHLERHEQQMDALLELLDQQAGTPYEPILMNARDLLDIHQSDHRHATMRVDAEEVVLRRQQPYLVYYDPDAMTWDDVEWYAVESIERKEVLKLNPDINKKALAALKGQPAMKIDPTHSRRRGNKSLDTVEIDSSEPAPQELFIRYWTIHDCLDNQMVIVAEEESGEQVPLLVLPWPYPCKIVRPLVLNPVDDQIHGVSEVRRMELAHLQLQQVQAKINNYIARVPAAKVVVPDQLANDEAWVRKFQDPDRLVINGGSPDFASQIWNHTWPGIDRELLAREARIDNDLDSICGIPEFAQAEITKESATATATRDKHFAARVAADKEEVASMVSWWLEAATRILRELGTTEQLVRLVGDEGRSFERMNPNEIPATVLWCVDADSLAPTQRDLERKQTVDLLTVLQPWMDPTPVMRSQPILSRVLRKFDGPEDLSEVFVQPAPPQPLMPAPPMGPEGQQPPADQPMAQAPAAEVGAQGLQSGGQLAAAATA